MKESIRKGLGFGLTSGVITTLGLIVGLYSSTRSEIAVISGILVIAIADSMSDALGIHISEESASKNTKGIWEATITTFLSKLIFALTFIVPVLIFNLYTAIIISVIWGLSLIAIFSFYIAKKQNEKVSNVVAEHLIIAIIVIILTYYVGELISIYSGGI
jgi:VIT1/CCC1 family predicted Fe2+/Mn2+ transporter